MAREGTLLKYWDIAISADGQVAKDVTARFINGYVPFTRKKILTMTDFWKARAVKRKNWN